MAPITPCLWCDGTALAQATFYTGVFPRSEITGVHRQPDGTVVTVAFTLDGTPFTALDGGPQFRPTEAVSFVIGCAEEDEVDRYWEALVEGGGSHGACGWLKDRWGVSWQVVPDGLGEVLGDPDPERAGRALAAMLAMSKLDLPALRAAADGAS